MQHGQEEFQLYFSAFPLISIAINTPIVDEPKRLANFIFADDQEIKISSVGIELRGGSSQNYPKKTYDLEFWDDLEGDDSADMQFGSLREDDDWVLDALYNEPLRLRALTSHKLWLDIHAPHYIDEEDKAKSGADVMYVDLFLNGEYRGVYMLSEQVDRKQLKVKKLGDNNEIRGEVYKAESWVTGNVTYTGLPTFNNNSSLWGGQELKHPDEDDIIDWSYLYDFTDFIMNSSDSEFQSNIAQQVHLGNSIDYFIFLNLLRATDNRGKNVYTAKYNQDYPYFFVPWDLDGVFGTKWTGANDNNYNDILSNGLFDRLIHATGTSVIRDKAAQRWFELREGIFADDELELRLVDNYELLSDNRVYEREALVWQNYLYDESSKNYMTTWLANRLIYLDDYFGQLLNSNEFEQQSGFKVFPNPSSDIFIVDNNFNSPKDYLILDFQGKLIVKGQLDKENNTLNLSKVSKGIYLLNIENSTEKLIIN